MSGNVIAEVLDTVFNGRPAPKAKLRPVRITLTEEQVAALARGSSLRFRTPGQEITVVPPMAAKGKAR